LAAGLLYRARSRRRAAWPSRVAGALLDPHETHAEALNMKIKPLNDKIVIKRLEAEEKTKGGIVLPDTAKEKPKEGRVVSVGEGKLLENGKRATLTVKANDRVIFSSYAGTEIKLSGEEYLILSEDDVLAIVD
jgi:chaperonin GroES